MALNEFLVELNDLHQKAAHGLSAGDQRRYELVPPDGDSAFINSASASSQSCKSVPLCGRPRWTHFS